MYDIGISFEQELENHFIVTAVLWHRNNKPCFQYRGISLPDAKRNFISVIIVQGSNLIKTINAACNRTVEQLLIQRLVPTGTKPDLNLLMTSNKYSKNIILPTEKHKSHWLISVANRVLNAWLDGER